MVMRRTHVRVGGRRAIFRRESTIMSLMKVADIMSPHVITVDPSATVGRARDLMRAREIHHMVVTEQQRVVGLLSLTDLGKVPDDHAVSEVMQRNGVTIDRSATIREAASLMNGNGVGCVAVLSGGALCGIVTTADLRRAVTTSDSRS